MKSQTMITKSRQTLTSTHVNSSLRELYIELWPRLVELLPDDESFSNPLLIKVRQTYCDAPYRVAVIGQQTDTWFNEVRTRELPRPGGDAYGHLRSI